MWKLLLIPLFVCGAVAGLGWLFQHYELLGLADYRANCIAAFFVIAIPASVVARYI